MGCVLFVVRCLLFVLSFVSCCLISFVLLVARSSLLVGCCLLVVVC